MSKIKMRVSKEELDICSVCGYSTKDSLVMFEVKIGKTIHSVCDKCMEDLFGCSLKATRYTDSKFKSQDDIKIINARNKKAKGNK